MNTIYTNPTPIATTATETDAEIEARRGVVVGRCYMCRKDIRENDRTMADYCDCRGWN